MCELAGKSPNQPTAENTFWEKCHDVNHRKLVAEILGNTPGGMIRKRLKAFWAEGRVFYLVSVCIEKDALCHLYLIIFSQTKSVSLHSHRNIENRPGRKSEEQPSPSFISGWISCPCLCWISIWCMDPAGPPGRAMREEQKGTVCADWLRPWANHVVNLHPPSQAGFAASSEF